MKKMYLCASIIMMCTFLSLHAQDWVGVPVPANPGNNMKWQIQSDKSDDFNYNGKNATFKNKWLDNHRNGWSGPGETQFSSNHSSVSGGNLLIKAGRVTNISGKTVYCGHVTTKNPIVFPVFTEVRMKCSGINLSSNFWLLSADDVNEIDITETYGAESNAGKKMATNFHIFQRSPFRDLANSPMAFTSQGNVFLKDDYHRFGVYWKSATEFEFYFDGKFVRALNKSNDLKDPRNRFFDQAMHIIMNTELHSWKSNAGIRPSNAELNNNAINKMYVDWVRTYKPVPSNESGENTDQLITNGIYEIKSSKTKQNVLSRALENYNAIMINEGDWSDQQWIFKHLGNNLYTIKNSGTNRFLEVPFAKCANGANVATWTNDADNHKKWYVSKNGNDFILKPAHCTAKALDVTQGRKDANVQLREYDDASINQQWQIIKISNNNNNNLVNNDGQLVADEASTLNTEGIVDISKQISVINPVTDALIINSSVEVENIKIYNLSGGVVASTVDVSKLVSGVYIVLINTSKGTISKKIVKK